MNLIIELRSDQQRTFVGFVRNDAVALCILNKSEEIFYRQNAIRCGILHLSFWAKSPFPAETGRYLLIFSNYLMLLLLNILTFLINSSQLFSESWLSFTFVSSSK